MARPDTLIEDIRSRISELGHAFDNLAGVKRRYVALGGETFLAPYFLNGDGEPRTDLDLKPEDIPNALTTLAAIETLLAQGHMTNLAKLIR